MSDPKEPHGMSDGAQLKKASKKKTTFHSDVSHPPVVTTSSSIDAVLQIPPIQLAEPKPDTDFKRPMSKKRIKSTSRSDVVSESGPDILSTFDTAAAKEKEDAGRDKEKRREAKKKRTQELEEAKRRQELEKEAFEQAQRLHNQQQRETRQKQQIEALNANAEECQEDTEDYEDEDFENYDEDFENEENNSEPMSLPALVSKKTQGDSVTTATADAELRRIQQAMQAESKGLQSMSLNPSGGSSFRDEEQSNATKRSTIISSSIADLKQSLDPRAKRIKKILEQRDFGVEKFVLFQLNPVSEHERVSNRLRRGLSKQAFVQTNDGPRSLGTQTKALNTHDKSMHFPDDIGIGMAKDRDNDKDFACTSTSRFFRFLEHAGYVCECLAVENTMESERYDQSKTSLENHNQSGQKYHLTKDAKLNQKSIFPSNEEKAIGSLRAMVQNRNLVALRFSPIVSNILLSCYGNVLKGSNEPVERYENKTISCVWDINRPVQPIHVLQSEGLTSSACLSPLRDLFVIVGTQDGTIHVWDLRPQSTIQSSTSLVDGHAICVPAYSTCGMDYRAPEQHISKIVTLEAIDSSQSVVNTEITFQFGSMDDRDWCQSKTNHEYTHRIAAARFSVLKFLPHDSNQFVVGMRTGQIVRHNRFGKVNDRMQYHRERGIEPANAYAGVVCIDFHPFESDCFLTGYEDGRICLYHVNVSQCLTCWEQVAFGVSVCAVAWSISRPGVFYASYSDSILLVWDLMECSSGPTLSHDLGKLKEWPPGELTSSLYPLVLSSEKIRTSRPAIAWRVDPSVSSFQFSVNELGPEFITRAAMEQQTVANVLAHIL
ncbi:Cytoplasmic dynein intermediate chain [Plasmopara halstedii]|uniref:Cytoplasmic dynein intermediate chain n=1 Tax=Plasmopara halstedii TaxID=4781 RepID=A0A0P1ANR4_PLAHL|nr:Cytoplasmic dynein intermediate chain [Plasmopara halstedii]CEG43087.1 Cytoplasmic dynein intermediate chain [Plasmopara halstedii]|eukprot:XP_024579456.1 Cytoplasmic dynein intermediate chain [Plasmopara halstedii]